MISDAEMEQYRQDLIAYEAKYGREDLDATKTTFKKQPKKNQSIDISSNKLNNQLHTLINILLYK
jgi:hypothetical protein